MEPIHHTRATREGLVALAAEMPEDFGGEVTELNCDLCPGEPVRKIVSKKIVNRRQDPTVAYTLACGHTVI